MRTVLIEHNGHQITAESQYLCIDLLKGAREDGLTSREIEDATKKSHGTISGALSRLQEMGIATQLTETRESYRVYVLVEFVGDRDTIDRYHFRATDPELQEQFERYQEALRMVWRTFPMTRGRIAKVLGIQEP